MNFFSSLLGKIEKKTDLQIAPPTRGLSVISNISSGEFGTICKGSLPLQNFSIENKDIKENLLKGTSTPLDACSGRFLKASLDAPLSTSEVRNCSVVYLYNTGTTTHLLLHVHPRQDINLLGECIQNLMLEGFDGGAIVLGENWLYDHQKALPYMFSTLKTINPTAIVNVYHCMSSLPEIVGYKGNCFQIPRTVENIIGQASFAIIDLFVSNIPYIASHCSTPESIQSYKEICSTKYTPEIMKILQDPLERREKLIQDIFSGTSEYTIQDCRRSTHGVSDIMYAKLERQWLGEIESISTKDALISFLSIIRKQIIPASSGFERTHIMGHHLKTLNQKLFKMVKKFGIEDCEERDILFDQEGWDKRRKELDSVFRYRG